MTIITKKINAKNPLDGICLFSNIFSNMFYVCLVNVLILVIIILWINNEMICLKSSNVKIIFYFYIASLITLTLNNNSIIKNIKEQYEESIIDVI